MSTPEQQLEAAKAKLQQTVDFINDCDCKLTESDAEELCEQITVFLEVWK